MPTDAARIASILDVVDNYDTILLDAYGVLVSHHEALPGATALCAQLRERNIEHFLVTNDASRQPATIARRMTSLGLDFQPQQVITSGCLLPAHFAGASLQGARCMVLGTPDACLYVEQAGGELVAIDEHQECDAIVVCDDSGYDFLPAVEAALSCMYRSFDRGTPVAMILPNPDLVYPKRGDCFGFTSGAVALLLEAALDRRYPNQRLRFTQLGKPHPHIFNEAKKRASGSRLLMVGDQLETDIAGAMSASIDSVLVTGGVTRWDESRPGSVAPTYVTVRL